MLTRVIFHIANCFIVVLFVMLNLTMQQNIVKKVASNPVASPVSKFNPSLNFSAWSEYLPFDDVDRDFLLQGICYGFQIVDVAPRGDAGGLSREYVLRIPSVS